MEQQQFVDILYIITILFCSYSCKSLKIKLFLILTIYVQNLVSFEIFNQDVLFSLSSSVFET